MVVDAFTTTVQTNFSDGLDGKIDFQLFVIVHDGKPVIGKQVYPPEGVIEVFPGEAIYQGWTSFAIDQNVVPDKLRIYCLMVGK